MRYTITPYAYRKIRETIKTSQKVLKAVVKHREKYPDMYTQERVVIKLTVIK